MNCSIMGSLRAILTRRFLSRLILALGMAVCLSAAASAAVPNKPAKKVLLISTGSRLAPGFILADKQVLQAMAGITSERVEIYAENLDLVRFPEERYRRIFSEYLTAKYAVNRPDLVILIFVGNLDIPGKFLPQLFPRTPIIVAGLTEEELHAKQFGPFVSGLAQRDNPRATLDLILRLQPETRRVVVIGGTSEIDQQVLQRVRDAAGFFAGRLTIEYWDDRTMAQLDKAVRALPRDTVILFARLFRDAADQDFISTQVAQSIAQSASVPVYVMTDGSMGTGAVGGALASIAGLGQRAGELARRVLTGIDLKQLPFEVRSDTVPTFDWTALQRWSIPEDRLPPGSVVLNKPVGVWAQYRGYIFAAVAVMVLQALLIFALLLQRARRRRAEAELAESQRFMELATLAGGVGLWVRDLTSAGLWVNPRARSMLGFAPADNFKFEDVVARINSLDRARVMKAIERSREASQPFEVEFRTSIAGVPERWISALGDFVRDPQGKPQLRMGTLIDITERKQMEEKFRWAIEAFPNALVMVDQQGEIVLVNDLTEKLFGYARAELIGQSVEMLIPERFRTSRPAQRAAFFGVPQSMKMGGGDELFVRSKDGSEFLVEIHVHPIETPEGRLVLTAIVDVREQRRLEAELQRNREELAHMTRVATVAELTTSIAHELNQPLGAILSNAEAAEMFLKAEPPALDEVRDILVDIRKDDERAGEVIRRIRSLLRKQRVTPNAIEVNPAVDGVIKLLHMDAAARKVTLKFETTAGLPRIWCDPIQFQQVLLNLALNGMDSMAGLTEEKRQLVFRTGRGDNGWVKIAVADSGPGIPADELPKLFEPFFSTKEYGMGIGLSVARTIIEAHHGKIWAENNPAAGATFYFTVPVEGGTDESREASEPVTPTPERRNLVE